MRSRFSTAWAAHALRALWRWRRGRRPPRRQGPLRSVARAGLRLVERALGGRFAAQVNAIAEAHRDVPATFVFLPALEWDLPLFQRPQQLALALAEAGALVLYVEPLHAGNWGLRQVRQRLFVGGVSPSCLRGLKSPVAWTLCWNAQHLAALQAPFVIYDHIDELSVFDAPQTRVREAHARLLREADLVLATALRLHRETLHARNDALLVPNGVDYAHFASARQPGPRPAEWGAVPAGRAVVGYYGALARWLDYGLLEQAARTRPELAFVLIGPDHDGTLGKSGLLELDNVHWLGPVPYERLPEHVRHFDVATIPFVLDDVTHAVSPLKLFEYMAAGRPIVITAMEESLRYPGPLVARDSREFSACLDQALALGTDAAHKAALVRVAAANTWSARAAQVLAALDGRRAPAH